MDERNKHTLKRALDALPEYQPSPTLWNSIEAEQLLKEQEAALQRAIRRLPEYAPPPSVWENIHPHLNQPPVLRLLQRVRPYRWAAAAAVVAIVYTTASLYKRSQQPRISYLAHTEKAAAPFTAELSSQDEAAIEEIGTAFTAYHAQFNDPQGNELLGELKELDTASKELREVLQSYGFDENLAQELTRVELQRDQVIRKMAAVL